MDIYEEMLLQIVEVLKKHNKPLPDLTHKEAIEEIRSIITSFDSLTKPKPVCGNCSHLILKDYKYCYGTCFYTHRIKSFYDECDHIENKK